METRNDGNWPASGNESTALLSGGDGATGESTSRKASPGPHIIPKNYSFLGKVVVALGYLAVVAYTLLVLFGPLLLLRGDESEWCPVYQNDANATSALGNDATIVMASSSRDHSVNQDDDLTNGVRYENPDYDTNPCRYVRLKQLLYLTLEECDLSRRMLAAILFGGCIGFERRTSDRPAGIRTMGLVSLGACFFTISSQLAFKSSTMGWDSSRVSAAIPSGVGFLGAGLIWKGQVAANNGGGGDEGQKVHQVHGLTTAASLWLSAAVGVGAGGALYFVSAYSMILVIAVLRFGPKMYFQDDGGYNDDDDEEEEEEEDEKAKEKSLGGSPEKGVSEEDLQLLAAWKSRRNAATKQANEHEREGMRRRNIRQPSFRS